MNKKNILEKIKTTFFEKQKLLEDGESLIYGENKDLVQEPEPYNDNEFVIWVNSNEKLLQCFDWFNDLRSQHQKAYDTYYQLYAETVKIYNPKKLDELLEIYTALKERGELLDKVLKAAEKNIISLSDDEIEELIKNTNETNNIPKKEESDLRKGLVEALEEENELFVTYKDREQIELHKQLKEQDLKQLELEYELTQQELSQLCEREALTKQSIEQLNQYHLLMQKESQLRNNELKEQERQEKHEQSLKQQELAELEKLTEEKMQELEQMEVLSLNHERKKIEGQKSVEEKLKFLVEEQELVKLGIEQVDKQLATKQKDLQQLKKQVALTEQDITQLEAEKKKKEENLQEFVKQELSENSVLQQNTERQEQLKQRRAEVEELKYKELDDLNELHKIKQKELLVIEQILQEINKQTNETILTKQTELDQQKQRKQAELKSLEEAQLDKQKALDNIQEKQKLISVELEKIRAVCQKASNKDQAKEEKLEKV